MEMAKHAMPRKSESRALGGLWSSEWLFDPVKGRCYMETTRHNRALGAWQIRDLFITAG